VSEKPSSAATIGGLMILIAIGFGAFGGCAFGLLVGWWLS
jgi:hypothetical protein